jgi:quercetin dioxygenase-like cupin family protein
MHKPRTTAVVCLAASLCASGIAYSEDAPKGNKGLKSSKATVVELGPEFSGMEGRQLRLRILTLEPGGYIGMHSHRDRPSTVYFMQGTDTVTRDDGTSHTFHAGDTTAEPGTTVHWHRNDGKDDVILITTDVFNTKTKTTLAK